MSWSPQTGPQHALVRCPVSEIFYGGARGGGKTDGVIGKYAIKEARYGSDFNAVIFRKELPMLDDLIERSKEIYTPLGGEFSEHKKTWRMPNGGRLRFRPLERTSDADKFQGQNLTDACVEEAGQYATANPIDRLFGALRSAKGVPTQLMLTGNPGGPGQLWIKARYIDPCPTGMKIQARTLPNGKEHKFVFIPSKIQNNKALLDADPDYIDRLYLVGGKELVKAWLEGDWGAIEGAYFDDWSQDMVIEPFKIPDHWTRLCGFDWGSAKPFAAYWAAVASEDYVLNSAHIPKGALVFYREWYGARKTEKGETIPNVGLKMTAEEVGRGIKSRSDETIHDYIADPAIFTEDGGPSIAERMNVPFRRADNKRVAAHGHVGGWDMMRGRMKGEDGRPMIYFFDTCVDAIRTIPVLQHDETRAEDLDSDGEDHAADTVRYMCMARPWTSKKPKVKEPLKIVEPTLDELFKAQRTKQPGVI
ncbi:MAG: hypothetical protein ACPG6R_11895 [Aequoribacter sp.]|uniref:hypothetical protein n=1 Tax=Aequoribacter sp. TaxID=2847771 RepID=UPI003C6B07A8